VTATVLDKNVPTTSSCFMSESNLNPASRRENRLALSALAYFDEVFPYVDGTQTSASPDPVPIVEVRNNTSEFLAAIRSFKDFGQETVDFVEAGIPYFVNEFWTSGQRQAHSIHEISYRACFKPQLPEFFISRLTSIGDGVYDPFMGRGTTPIQSALMGRKPLANDINPLSVLLTRPRLQPPNMKDVSERLAKIDWEQAVEIREDLLVFFHPTTLRQIHILKDWILNEAPLEEINPDPVVDWIRMVAINRMTGHSPGFFSVYTLPPNQAVTIEAQKKINEKRNQVPPPRDIFKIILKKSYSLLSDGYVQDRLKCILSTNSATNASAIPESSAALVVTSPPFLDIVQYAKDNWLRCWFAGIDPSAIEIAMHRSAVAWQAMIKDVLIDLARILKSGGHVAFEVGEVRKGKILLDRLVWEAAEHLPFERIAVIVNQQEFTKTANCWGVANNSGGTNSNRIILLRRR
jgi:hypothetical protein